MYKGNDGTGRIITPDLYANKDEFEEVKTSVSEGKKQVASAITDKGISTASDASFSTMAENISKISSGLNRIPVADRDFTYTGGYTIKDDSDTSNTYWRIKFTSSGIFTPLIDMTIDVFCVGGGGSGGPLVSSTNPYAAAGGGGGYTKTEKSIVLSTGTPYKIVIGSGGDVNTTDTTGINGGDTLAFSATANGGSGGNSARTMGATGGDGGSGGGAVYAGGNNPVSNGGSDGSDGGTAGDDNNILGGIGQGTTTREFGESTGDLYAGGGGSVTGTLIPFNSAKIGNGGEGGGGTYGSGDVGKVQLI